MVAKAYDKCNYLGLNGLDPEYPEYIKNDPDYQLFLNASAEGLNSKSGDKDIKDYLSPAGNMNFIDLGCFLNLMFRVYNEWPSTYYGVDVSSETIKLLNTFAAEQNLAIGSLFCGGLVRSKPIIVLQTSICAVLLKHSSC